MGVIRSTYRSRQELFLGTCDGWEMGIKLQTDYYEALYMKIYEEDPITTSAAVVRDMINTIISNDVN